MAANFPGYSPMSMNFPPQPPQTPPFPPNPYAAAGASQFAQPPLQQGPGPGQFMQPMPSGATQQFYG